MNAPLLLLTFNDAPSGIYAGQVIDVCRFVQANTPVKVQLVAFLSLRGFSDNRRRIKAKLPNAIVLPMFPKARNWRLNGWLLRRVCKRTGARVCMGRGPFATALALGAREKGVLDTVIFDGRGAYVAELTEYNVIPDPQVKAEIAALERQCVTTSDRQLAVSEALVAYWRDAFGYARQTHRVIPCTLNSGTVFTPVTEAAVAAARAALGIPADACVVVYSGSAAGWQSLEEFGLRVLPQLAADDRLHLLLLVKSVPERFVPQQQFPERVHQRWLQPEAVGQALLTADYGWLVREDTVTNRVASPVKFAEYLAAGLHVLISDHLGDASAFVRRESCGIVLDQPVLPVLTTVSCLQRSRLQDLAQRHFTKDAYLTAYTELFS